MNKLRRTTVHATCVLAAITAFVGCKLPNGQDRFPTLAKVNRHMPWHDENEPVFGTPARMEVAWTDNVLYKQGQKPQRGLGGRIMFYGKDGEKPILVDGEFVVYAFDEANRKDTDNKPTRRYVFKAEDLPKRMNKNDIGAGYNFWLPWDEVGGKQTEVSVICRFQPKKGGVVVSEQTRQMLPGELRPEQLAKHDDKTKVPEGVPYKPAQVELSKNVNQASYNAAVPASGANNAVQPAAAAGDGAGNAAAPQAAAMNTMTISLPNSYAQRMNSAGLAAPQVAGPTAGGASVGIPVVPANPPAQVSPGALPPATTPAEAAALRNSGYRLNAVSGTTNNLPFSTASWPQRPAPQPQSSLMHDTPQGSATSAPTNGATSGHASPLSSSGYNTQSLAPASSMPISPIGS